MWQQAISEQISQITSQPFVYKSSRAVGGGCINDSVLISGEDGRDFFIKLNQASRLSMFQAEQESLQAIIDTKTIHAPQPLGYGTSDSNAYLILEALSLGGAKQGSQQLLGEQLAAMHRHTQPLFGWYRDNTIGSTPQINTEERSWHHFWVEHRLGYQLDLAASNGYHGKLQLSGRRLLETCHLLLQHQPVASLLHGDLWSGNYAFTSDGQPVIYDPALYYGDRETDLAMTELFGGFSTEFYAAYRSAFAVDSDYKTRKTLYNLYHILNHLNLFGGGYLSQAQGMIDQLLAEIG